MAGKSTGLPANIPPELRRALETMKESVDQGEGNRGDPLLRNLKVKDLIDLGLAKRLGSGAQQIVSGGNLQPTTPPSNTAVPPAPAGFEVNSGVFHILLEWDPPREAYGNHAYTEVYRNTTDNRANAVLIAQADGFLHPDMDVSFGTTYYYWVRFVSTADVTGPYNAANGTEGAVSENPQELLDRLNGEITESQLYADLNDRIDLVDGPESLTGSVNQRIQVTEDGLAQDILQLSTTVDDNTATIQTQAQSIDGLEGSYTVKVDVNGQVAGYGLSVEGNDYDDSVDSTMLFSVDTFAIGSPGADELSFIVDNGQVVMDAAYIVNLVVNDADIVSVDVEKINGLNASFIEAEIENLHVDKISGDVNYTLTQTDTSGFSVDSAGINFVESVALSIPSDTRARIPLLFSRAILSFSSSGITTVNYAVFDLTGGTGSYTTLDTPDSQIAPEGFRWEVVVPNGQTPTPPAGWDQVSTNSEIAWVNGTTWRYGIADAVYVTDDPAGPDDTVYGYMVEFSEVYARGTNSDGIGSSHRVRNGSSRLFNNRVGNGGFLIDRDNSGETEINSYVLNLPRTSSSKTYAVFMAGVGGSVEETEFTAVMMR